MTIETKPSQPFANNECESASHHFTGLQYSYDAVKRRIQFVFPSGELLYRVHFGINGFNDLPNFIGIDKSTDNRSWELINTAATDWLPPLRVAAANNGDGSGKYATGGNHGNVDKSAKGDKTARNTVFEISIDGRRLCESEQGQTEAVDLLVVNEIMGWNTTLHHPKYPRYLMKQTFRLTFRAGTCDVSAQVEALEDVQLARDSALQCVTTGFQERMCFYGKGGMEPYVNHASSGSKASAPDVYGVGLYSEQNGTMIMWLDREWEAGRGDMLLEAHPLVRISGSKAYLAVALDVDEHQTNIHTLIPLRAGQSYRYRGGYRWQAASQHEQPGSSASIHPFVPAT